MLRILPAMAARERKKDAQNIRAFVRFNTQELDFDAKRCVELHGNHIVVNLQHGTREYIFDKVFDSNCKQKDVYIRVVNPLVADVIRGYNCTVLAYGQTGSGKTYTMVGHPIPTSSSHFEDSEAGMIPRTLAHLFEQLNKNSKLDFTVRVSYIELYNEVLIDLLASEDKNLKIYEDQKNKGSIQIYDVEEVTIFNKEQAYEILQHGIDNRKTAMTLMNSQSSCSHTIFTVTLHIKETSPNGEEMVKTGKLNLVDLADMQRSGAMDKRNRVLVSINQSLLSLDRVIKALVEKSVYIPYKESKLTRILEDSLGGKTKTAIIATISAAPNHMDETMITLHYAQLSRKIQNYPEANQSILKTALIQGYLDQIDELKKDVLTALNQKCMYLNPDNYNLRVAGPKKRKEDLLKTVEECAKFVSTVHELEHKTKELDQVCHITNTVLQGATFSLDKAKENIKKLREERQIHQDLIDKFEQAKSELIDDNRSLSNTLNQYLFEHQTLQTKLDDLHTAEDKNDDSARQLQTDINISCAFTSEKWKQFANSVKEKTQWIQNDMTDAIVGHEQQFEKSNKIIDALRDNLISTMRKTQFDIEELDKKQMKSMNESINEHLDIISKLDTDFALANKAIADNFNKMAEKLDMCSTANAQILLNTNNIAWETQKRLTGKIESITHDLDVLAIMTENNIDEVSKKFGKLSMDTENSEYNTIEQLQLIQEHKSKLAHSQISVNELMKESVNRTVHAQTTCKTMQNVIDDGTTIICNNTAGMAGKIEQTISEMVHLKELEKKTQKEIAALMNGVEDSHKQTFDRLRQHAAYNEMKHGQIVKTYMEMVNDQCKISSSLKEKLDDHDETITTCSERVFKVLEDLEIDATSNTLLISKDLNVIKETVDKYVGGLTVVKPSGDAPIRSDENNTSLEEEIEIITSNEDTETDNIVGDGSA